jgi:hypothetical protein
MFPFPAFLSKAASRMYDQVEMWHGTGYLTIVNQSIVLGRVCAVLVGHNDLMYLHVMLL